MSMIGIEDLGNKTHSSLLSTGARYTVASYRHRIDRAAAGVRRELYEYYLVLVLVPAGI